MPCVILITDLALLVDDPAERAALETLIDIPERHSFYKFTQKGEGSLIDASIAVWFRKLRPADQKRLQKKIEMFNQTEPGKPFPWLLDLQLKWAQIKRWARGE